MIPAAVARRLLHPLLAAEQFVPTQFSTAEDKAQFGNRLLRFMADDFAKSQFTEKLYRRLHHTFGNIAHYDRNGFFETWFADTGSKLAFVRNLLSSVRFAGRSECTFSDVEHAIRTRVADSGVVEVLSLQLAAEIGAVERAELARLKAKYEREDAPLARPLPVKSTIVQEDLFGPGR